MGFDQFTEYIKTESSQLTQLSDYWANVLKSGQDLGDEIPGHVYSAIGKAKLLLSEKMKHFEELIQQAQSKTSVKVIRQEDLEGFMDTVKTQVEEVKRGFANLDQMHKEFNKNYMDKNLFENIQEKGVKAGQWIAEKKNEILKTTTDAGAAAKDMVGYKRDEILEETKTLKGVFAKKKEEIEDIISNARTGALDTANEAKENPTTGVVESTKKKLFGEQLSKKQEADLLVPAVHDGPNTLESDETSGKTHEDSTPN